MTMILTIENAACLPKGVLTSVQLPSNGRLDIGRNQNVGWTLPDAHRFISGKHCEIHDRAGTFWLYDTSTNGTFMKGETNRMKSPRALSHGDQFAVGIYVITVAIKADSTDTRLFPAEGACGGGKALQCHAA